MTLDTKAILDEAYKTAFAAAIQASEHVLTYWPNPLNKKFDKNLVMQIFDKNQGIGNYATIADTESEAIILKKINKNNLLKKHGIVTEESEGVHSHSVFQWVIDPIDGTLNFRNGMHDFCVVIGLLHEYKPVLGIIAMPAVKQVLVARTSEGAKLFSFDGELLLDVTKIAYTETLQKAFIAYDTGYEKRAQQLQSTVEKIADKIGYPVSYASAAMANYRVAMSHVAAYFHQTPTKYDVVASAVIVSEVGGVVTDMQGNPIDWSAPTISYLAARTPEIHKQLLELLKN